MKRRHAPVVATPLVQDAEGGPERGRPVSVGELVECAVGVAVGAVGLAAGHLPCLAHLLKAISNLDEPAHADWPHILLERAALLESFDMGAALALYEHIVLHHPGTAAAKEASRNLQTLRAAHPELAR